MAKGILRDFAPASAEVNEEKAKGKDEEAKDIIGREAEERDGRKQDW